jgi:hypothetical protein
MTFSIVRGNFSILMPCSFWFFAAKNWFLHIQCATMFTVALIPVVLVFGFTRTDTVFYCGILNIQVYKRVGVQVAFG